MRIAHVSDIHIRNLKFHQDYKRTFDDFYRKLEEHHVDLVVNTGDTAHTKTNISPEFVSVASEFFTEVAKRCPMVNVLGNHDLNLMNEDRQDAITPIIEALNINKVTLHKKAGPFPCPMFAVGVPQPSIMFWNLAIADTGNWPHAPYPKDTINIGLFHGSVRDCVTDSLFRMTHVEYDHDIFEGLDFVMMGDIHKRQSFNDGRVWYAGSMIQQNFGEDPEKGFLLWDIESKDKWSVKFVELKGARKFYTLRLTDDLRIPDMAIEPDSRIRIAPPRSMTLVEQKTIEKLVKRKYTPHDVITLGVANISQSTATVDGKEMKVENLRDVTVQENLIRNYLSGKKLKEDVINRVLDMNRKYQTTVEQREDMARGVNWRVLKMGWNNLYNYGEGNIIDFSQIKGLTGLFAPNASGKSGMIDVVTVGMFDANTKEVSKNIHLVNDNKDKAAMILELLANGERYTVTREIERIKFARKGQAQEWGKTTLDFIRHDKDGGVEKLVMESRPDTEKQIRRRFGSFEDFMLTSLFAQWDPMDLIMCKETDRKRILFRFLDLDIFEEKGKLAKDDSREWMDKLADLEESNYEVLRDRLMKEQSEDEAQLNDAMNLKAAASAAVKRFHSDIEELASKIVPTISSVDVHGVERKLRELNAELSEAADEIKKFEKNITTLQATFDRDTELSKQWDRSALKKEVEKFDEVSTRIFSVKAILKDHKRHVDDAQRQMAVLGQVPCGDKFPGCKFIVDAFEAKKHLPGHQQEVAEFEAELATLTADAAKYQNSSMELDKCDRLLASIEATKNMLRVTKLKCENYKLSVKNTEAEKERTLEIMKRHEQAKADLEKNEEIRELIAELKQGVITQEDLGARWERESVELHRQMGARKNDIERLDNQISKVKETRETCTAFEHYIDAMGKDGIALQVLRQKLPIINEEINKVLGSATEFGVFIEYDNEDQSIRLYIQYGQYKSRLLELGSGAEKFLASVAIRSALLSISNLPRSNMFIIDEGFGKLDPQNLEAIQRMFDYLKSVFDHVIVISHSDLMKDMVDNMIDITPDDEGYAHVEIGG